MNNDFLLKQITEILSEYEIVIRNAEASNYMSLTVAMVTSMVSKAKAVTVRIAGTNSEYYKEIEKSSKENSTLSYKLSGVFGSIYALKNDFEKGYLKSSLYGLVQAEIFSDYLEMSEYLLGEGYKDAAAVLVGSTLEANLKELAKENNIDLQIKTPKGELVTKRANTINDELLKAGVYNTAHHKQIIAWLAIRNCAAHGDYSKYTPESIGLMVQGVRLFTLK